MYERFTDRARKVMQLANQEAQRFNHEYIGTEHILLGLIKEGSGVAANVLKNLDIDLRKIRLEVEKIVQAGPHTVTVGKLPQTPRAKKVIEYAIEEARSLNHNYVGTEHLLLGILREAEGVAGQVLMNLRLRLENVREETLNLIGQPMESSTKLSDPQKVRTPMVDSYWRDLTELARAGNLDPVIGRHKEIDRIITVLSRRSRNHLVLLGDIGVGKSAIVKGLAQRIAAGTVPEFLRDRRLVEVDLASVAAGAKNHRHTEEIFNAAANEIRRAGNVLLWISDLARALVGSPDAASFRAASKYLKPALLRGTCQGIATASFDQYQQYIASDASLERHWQRVPVSASTPEETVEILRGLRGHFEEHHRVLFSDEALTAVVELCAQFLPEQHFPLKAVDLLDETGALLRFRFGNPQHQQEEELNRQIEELNQRKEERVANMDFDGAAQDRDQCDKLKKQREQLRRDWRATAQAVGVVADAKTVMEALNSLTGIDQENSVLPTIFVKGT